MSGEYRGKKPLLEVNDCEKVQMSQKRKKERNHKYSTVGRNDPSFKIFVNGFWIKEDS